MQKMEQVETKNEQRTPMNEIDYIDIPAFVRSFMRYARRYILLAVPLIVCMSVCLAMLSKPYAKKDYIAGGTAMIGIRLSDSVSFDYNLSGLSWDRQSTLVQMDYVLSELLGRGYIDQFVRDTMGIKGTEELNGQIYMNAAYMTNLVDIYVVSESPEDAEAIRLLNLSARR